jgi:hypothetical protein
MEFARLAVLPAIAMTVLVLLSACVTPEERARLAAEQEAEDRAREEAYLQTAKHQCSEYGHSFGTEPFARCMQEEVNAQRTRDDQAEMQRREELRRLQEAVAAKAARDRAEADSNWRESMKSSSDSFNRMADQLLLIKPTEVAPAQRPLIQPIEIQTPQTTRCRWELGDWVCRSN